MVILGVAAAFRVPLLDGPRLHPDEALFASFARDAAVRGEWWLPGNLDKTPLSIYAQAGAILAVGIEWDGAVWRLPAVRGELAARLPSFYTSLLLVAVTMRVARRLAGTRAGLLTGVLVALSPYGVVFGATAFTDGPMLLFAMLGVWAALRGRGAWAGMWLALAIGAKQQGVLFVPLAGGLLAMGVVNFSSITRATVSEVTRHWLALTGALAAGLVLLAVWDVARPEGAVWTIAAQNNAPDGWRVGPAALPTRLQAWAGLLRWLFGSIWATALVGVTAVVGYGRQGPAGKAIAWLALWLAGYGLLHWLVPLNIYDRYMLTVMPLLAVLVGVGLAGWFRGTGAENGVPTGWLIFVLAAVMLPGAWGASRGALPIGGDRGQHDGIIALTDYLNGREFGAIVYDRWLGWELDYYLGGWTDKRRAYYPNPRVMAADPALDVPDMAPRYFPAPTDVDVEPWLAALARAGFETCTAYAQEGFVVYALHQGAAVEPSAAALAATACAID